MPTLTKTRNPKLPATQARTGGKSRPQSTHRILQLVPPPPTDFHPPYFRGVPPMLDAVLGYTGRARYVLVHEHESQQVRLFDGHPTEWRSGDWAVWDAYLTHPAATPLVHALRQRAVSHTLGVVIDRQALLCCTWLWTDAWSWIWWMRVYHHRCTPRNTQFLDTTTTQRITALEHWLDDA